jgi:hypothetical protein
MLPRSRAWILLAVALAPAASHARTWRIRVDGGGDAPTVQAGIDSAVAGDVVLLAPGTYTWTQQQASTSTMLRLSPGVTLRGEVGALSTTLDAESRGRILACVDAGEVVIEDLTFRHGVAPSDGAAALVPEDSRGGAIDVRGATSPAIRRCMFADNVATGGTARGGAVACDGGVIEDCEFNDNVAGVSGPTNGHGGALSCGSAVVRRCVFRRNRVFGYENASGGALYTSSATIELCVFEENYVRSAGSTVGGAIRATASPLVSQCIFRRNLADGHYFTAKAGAAFVATGRVDGCLFFENTAQCELGPGQGGAIAGDAFLVSRSVFAGNTAARTTPLGPGNGGAIYARFHSTIESSTFAGNSGGTEAGAGCMEFLEGGTLNAVIVAQTTLGETCRGDATWTCSILFGNAAGDVFCGMDAGGNLVADPLFCADPRVAGDVSIRSTSVCAPGRGPRGCDGIGAGGVGCDPQAVESRTWTAVKHLYRGQ